MRLHQRYVLLATKCFFDDIFFTVLQIMIKERERERERLSLDCFQTKIILLDINRYFH